MQDSRNAWFYKKIAEHWRTLLGLFLLSIVFTATLSPILNGVVEDCIQAKEMIIHTGEGSVYLLNNGHCELFEPDQREELERKGYPAQGQQQNNRSGHNKMRQSNVIVAFCQSVAIYRSRTRHSK